MAHIIFTENLRRHIGCPEQDAAGSTLAEVLNNLFSSQQALKHYILDDQDRLRRHMLISIDGKKIKDAVYLSDPVQADSEIYIIQALSGG